MRIGVILDNEIKRDIRVLNELKSLVDAKHEVYLLCPSVGDETVEENFNGFTINRFTISKKRRDILFGINNTIPIYDRIWTTEIKKFVQKNQIKALHVHDLYMARPAYKAIKNSNIKITLDLHENYPEAIKTYSWANSFPKSILAQPKRWAKLEKTYLGYADNIVVLSESFRDELLSKYKLLQNKHFVVYPNVPDTKELLSYSIDPNIIEKDNSFILFYFGVIGVRRGIFTCFDALRILIKTIPQVTLLIIGPVDRADKARVNTYMSDAELAPHIIYYEWKDISLLPSYILASDVCLSPLFKNPQHESGLANKIFQYMLFGRPLLVSNCKPQADLVNDVNCGLVFQEQDPNDMANKVIDLYNNPELRQTMGNNSMASIKEKYNLEILGKNIANLYNY